MQKSRVVWLVLPWLLSAVLAGAVVWLAVELHQSRKEQAQSHQQQQEELERALEQLRQSEATTQELRQEKELRRRQIDHANQVLSAIYQELDPKPQSRQPGR